MHYAFTTQYVLVKSVTMEGVKKKGRQNSKTLKLNEKIPSPIPHTYKLHLVHQ